MVLRALLWRSYCTSTSYSEAWSHTASNHTYTENDITSMLNFLIDIIFVEFGGHIFKQTVIYSYGTEFIQKLLKQGETNPTGKFNSR